MPLRAARVGRVGVIGHHPRVEPLRELDAWLATLEGSPTQDYAMGGDRFSRAEHDAIAALPGTLFVVAAVPLVPAAASAAAKQL